MILFLAYVFFALAFIMVLVAAYNIYCIITLRLFKKEVCDSPNTNVEDTKTRFNLFIWIIKKSRKVKNASSPNEIEKAVKKKVRTFTFILVFAVFSNIYSAVEFIIYGSIIYTLNQQLTTVASAFNTIFGHDENCPCYALCTGDPADDSKSVYELLFGPDEYEKLIGLMDLTDEEYERFYGSGRYGQELEVMEGEPGYLKGSIEIINSGGDGRAKSEFIRDHINDDMVNAYRDLVSHNPRFRHGDGNDRSKMTQEQLREDLYKLLSDYKVNGRNPNCKCNTANKWALKKVCLGEEHWHEGWTWGTFYYPEPTYDEEGNPIYPDPEPENPGPKPGNHMGKATGQYAVQLDDGMYYWYHQDGGTGCGCVHCGDWSSAQWGSPTQWNSTSKDVHAFGKDGCAVYALAIGLSNLCGQEITPDVVFEVLNSPNNGGTIVTNQSYFSGRGINRGTACSALATKYGLTLSSHANDSATSVIAYIDDILSQGGIVWTSWVDAQCKWCSNGTSHFMCIRKSDGNNYYCFTSCRGKCASQGGKPGAIETMNYPLSKAECVSSMTSNVMYGFVNPNAGPGGGPGNTDPSNEGVFEKLSETKGTYNFAGKKLDVSISDGSTIPVYDGVPSEWGWSKSKSATVWHYQNTAAAWCKNFSSETGLTSCETYGHLNKEFPHSSNSSISGVKCLEICSTAAIIKCGFTPSNTKGVNDVGASAKGVAAVIICNSGGTYYYIPCKVTDAKAHTYPGGVVQTSCARYSNFSQCYSSSDDSCSDFGKAHAALHDSSGHYVYSDRKATVEIEANWTSQPIPSGWKIVDVIYAY